MVITNDDIETLAKKIEQARTALPHITSLINAFSPLMMDKGRWLMEVQEYAKKFTVDPVQYHDGKPLSQQGQLFSPDDPWKSAGLAVARGISLGFPNAARDMTALSSQIADGRLDCYALINLSELQDEAPFASRAAELDIEPEILLLFLRFLGRFMLTKKARDVTAELALLSWAKGYCPVCGSFPHLAILRENGQRWLQCGECSHEWKFSRLQCPHCEHEDPANTSYLFVDGNKEDTAFTCTQCQRYLVTSSRPTELHQTPADLIAITLAHLDIILQEKGFTPMAECEWNTLGSPELCE
jgi:FdhE protein